MNKFAALLLLVATVTNAAFLVIPESRMRIRVQRFEDVSPYLVQGTPYVDSDNDPTRWVPTYFTDDHREKVALDVQCGIGDSTHELSERLLSKGWKVIGIDENPSKIALAKKKHPSLLFFASSLNAFPRGSLDLIQVHTGRMLYIEKKWDFVQQIVRVLKPGGTLELFDFSISHEFIQEIMHMEEDHVRDRYFQGWKNYDPVYHLNLFNKVMRMRQSFLLEEQGIFHSTFVKF